MLTKLTKIDTNIYELSINSTTIKFKINDKRAVNIENKDMSADNVIFIKESYPTPDDESVSIIGHAYQYDNGKMIDDWLVAVDILDTNIDLVKAKGILAVNV